MGKFSLIALCVLVMSAQAARADFNGKWHGKGTLHSSQPDMSCDPMDLELAQTDAKFSFVKAVFECAGQTVDFGSFDLDIVNGHLEYYGKDLGTVTDSEFHLLYEETDYSYVLDMTITNGALTYHSDINDYGSKFGADGTFENVP